VAQYAHITGWGKSLPRKILTNFDLEKMVDTSDAWIQEHTGIRERRIAGPGEYVSTLSIAAGQQALGRAGMSPTELDLIILATSSPDYQMPGGATLIQAGLGATRAAAFDLRAGCSAFLYGLAVGSQFIASGTYRNILVIGAEIVSMVMDWSDRRTCVLFGDGAGAVVLEARDEPGGVLSFALGADGTQHEALYVPAGGCRYPLTPEVLEKGLYHIRMNGRQLLKFALHDPLQGVMKVIEAARLSIADIDLVIPSQTNRRLIEAICKMIGIPLEKVFINVDRYANTSAASVPIALCEALEEGRARQGDNIALMAYGAGLSWAAAVVHMGAMTETPISVAWPVLNRARNTLHRARIVVRSASATLAAHASALLLPFFTTSHKED